MKRKFEITSEFEEQCKTEFNNDTTNKAFLNTITSVGSFFSTIDYKKGREISHIFLNTLKKKHTRATNQNATGRCWMFSGLNVLRHTVIASFNLENFEFSEVYLYFYDRLERCNTVLHKLMEMGKPMPEDRLFEYLTGDDAYMSDGGYWNYFSNLVDKYGLVPVTAMPPTFQSENTEELNTTLNSVLSSATSALFSSNEISADFIEETLRQVYKILVLFLGEPPKTFDWSFMTDTDERACLFNLTPQKFYDMFQTKFDSFFVLMHQPKLEYYKTYEVNHTSNLIEGKNCIFLNVPIEEMQKYTIKSINEGLPVWLAGDVTKGFDYINGGLFGSFNENKDMIFGEPPKKLSKQERLLYSCQHTNHAMTVVGYNQPVNEPEKTSFQLENSWGYFDHEQPGLDGFLYADLQWFKEYCCIAVIHKSLLSRTLLKKFETEVSLLEPWSLESAAVGKTKLSESLRLKFLRK